MATPAKQTVVRMLQRPVGPIVPGKDLVACEEPAPSADQLQDGEVLLHRLYLSVSSAAPDAAPHCQFSDLIHVPARPSNARVDA